MTSLDLSGIGIKPPVIPSKYDIIPIHASDRGTYKRCRRRWDWSSPARRNLVPKVALNGVIMPLWFGTGIHYAMEKFYNPGLNQDPEVVFQTWFDLQWKGGIVSADDLDNMGLTDREPVLQANGYYLVKGLDDLLPVPNPTTFQDHLEIGLGMMRYYKRYAEQHDNFRVLMVEHGFSIPVLDNTGAPMYEVDTREMPEGYNDYIEKQLDIGVPENIYGPLWRMGFNDETRNYTIEKQVHARGRMDNIIQENEFGRYGIIDYKTAARVDDDYFRHLVLDEQCTTYLWAAEQEAKLYSLEYESVSYIIYQAMLKAYPKPPTITTRGIPSINRADESTTAEMFAETIDLLNLRSYYEGDDKMKAYYAWLIESADVRFINRRQARRNDAQKINAGRRLYLEAREMTDPNIAIYPNPTKDYICLNCQFRTPCTMAEDGSDYEEVLRQGFQRNWDR